MPSKCARTLKTLKFFLKLAGVGLLLAIILLAALVVFILINPAYAPSPETSQLVQAVVVKQQEVEANIHDYYQAGVFTFTAPLIIQDPYGRAPLTALLIFDTPKNTQISIHVPGRTEKSSVDFAFEGYNQHHEIPVYGLYPGSINLVTIRMKTQDGENSQVEIKLQTEPLPVYLEEIIVDKVNQAKYSPGFNFTFLEHKTIFDIDGAVRWYSTQATFQVFARLKNGRYLFSYPSEFNNVLMEQDLLGKIYAIYNIA
jgi:arylsulfate sulfotransferase